MAYPLDAEGLVGESSAPGAPLAEDAELSTGETDAGGEEVAPTLSSEALDAVDRLAQRGAPEPEA